MASKGIRSRSSPDFLSKYLSIGGFAKDISPTTHFLYVSLYNNDTSGSNLWVYQLAANVDLSIYALLYYVQGVVGAVQVSGIRVNPSYGAPPGQVAFLDNGAAAITNTPFGNTLAGVPNSTGIDYPFFILPPGYSLVVGTPTADRTVLANFLWIPMLDASGNRPG